VAIAVAWAEPGADAAPEAVDEAASVDAARDAKVERLLGELTLDERIAQIMMSYPPIKKEGPVTVGGVIFVGNLLKSEAEIKERIARMQARAKVPVLVSADVEGGKMNRLGFLPPLAELPSNLELGQQSPEVVRSWGRKVGEGMNTLGFHLALAPVLDVAEHGVMYEDGRTFGGSADTVATLGKAYVEGLRETGVAAIGKHWPGYGNLAENTDHHFVVTERTREEVEAQTAPFRAVGDGLAGVMLANVGFTTYGEVPAILSAELVDEAHDAGWLTITDDLAIPMLAEATGGDVEEVVRRAFLAGNDILLTTAPLDWDKALDYQGIVRKAIEAEPALEARLDASVRRVLKLKASLGLLD
jgi:beta-N-acetylhexosaminidase